MALEIVVPRLGWSMEQGVFAGWLKKDGDAVAVGDALFRLEGEKATEDIESLDSRHPAHPANGAQEGETVLVGTVIGYLARAGEEIPGERPQAKAGGMAAVEAPASPSVRRLAREMGVDLQVVAGSGAAGRITAEDVQQSSPSHTKPAISPRARRAADKLGVDWAHLKGSGRTGRIRERDVRQAAEQPAPIPQSGTLLPITPVRKIIADRMLRSVRTTAAVTLTTAVDATNLVNLRQQFKAAAATNKLPVPSCADFIVKLAATALQSHPLLSARWEDDHIALAPAIHIGIAVDTDAGLLVPVIRDVPSLGLRQLAARSLDLIERGHKRKLQADDMQGGTFTVTNLGAFGIDAFTPILNYPECSILGIGRIQRQAVVHENQITQRDRLTLSLTFDHRIVDGGPAARFLQTLSQGIENPGPWLME